MIVKLSYPDKILWPNGRTLKRNYLASTVKAHKRWAYLAALEADTGQGWVEPVPIRITVHPKARGPLPDADNCIAACKSYLDGIADAIGVNDRDFAAPLVSWGHRTKHGGFVIEVA
jgi:crossover junction endodeoxyribonuclease RusA